MALKNFWKVIAETPPEVRERVAKWMDEQDRLHESPSSLSGSKASPSHGEDRRFESDRRYDDTES